MNACLYELLDDACRANRRVDVPVVTILEYARESRKLWTEPYTFSTLSVWVLAHYDIRPESLTPHEDCATILQISAYGGTIYCAAAYMLSRLWSDMEMIRLFLRDVFVNVFRARTHLARRPLHHEISRYFQHHRPADIYGVIGPLPVIVSWMTDDHCRTDFEYLLSVFVADGGMIG